MHYKWQVEGILGHVVQLDVFRKHDSKSFIIASKIDLISKICVLRGKEWINAGQFGNTIKLILTSDKTKV